MKSPKPSLYCKKFCNSESKFGLFLCKNLAPSSIAGAILFCSVDCINTGKLGNLSLTLSISDKPA